MVLISTSHQQKTSASFFLQSALLVICLFIFGSVSGFAQVTCAVSTFQKIYGNNSGYESPEDIVETNDHGFMFVGAGGFNGNGYIARTDKTGKLLWLRQIGNFPTEGGILMQIIKCRDGSGYVTTGRVWTGENTFNTWLIKFDENGNFIWNKAFRAPVGHRNDSYRFCETADGGFAFAGLTHTTSTSYGAYSIWRASSTGDFLWGKSGFDGAYITSIIELNGVLYAAGSADADGVVIKLNSFNGNIISGKRIRVDNNRTRFYGIREQNNKIYLNGCTILSGTFDGLQQVNMIADTNINMLKCHKLDVGVKEVGELINMFPTDDGGFISSVDIEYPSHIYLVKVSFEGAIEWKRKFDYSGEQEIKVIHPTADKGVVGIAQYLLGTAKTWIFKTDSLGLTPDCFVAEPFAAITHPAYTVNPSGFSTSSFTLPVYTINSPNVSGAVQVITVCEKTIVPSCSMLSISGQDSICNTSNSFIYNANKSSDCNASVTWQIDTSIATIIAANSATVTIKYKKKGTTQIIASIATACEAIKDTLNVEVFASATALNLGPDLTFCNIKQATLTADSGYKNYLWNDGSKGRSIIATSTGKYFVTVNDVCNQSYSDTVNITSSSNLSFNVGANMIRCNNDTLVKSIAAGYASYKWSPSVGLSDTTTNIVKIFNPKDIVYSITVLREPGCYLTDSFKVSHYQSAVVGLRADTSICAGTILSLSPANIFKNLVWSTGETTNAIAVSKTGTYSVVATDSNTCISKDTFQLLNVYPLPLVNLGTDTSICRGSTFIVNAGSFSSYLWQDGSLNSTYNIKSTGTYWVKVSDKNNCINSDTLTITRLKEPTTNFLPGEIKICEGEVYVLKPTVNLTNRRWSTNETSSTISISKPGYYSLSAINDEGCTSDDTTLLTYNNCSKLIYFPTAFTPNNDSKNDVFRPSALAPLDVYRLIIYNRFGQKVFETTNINEGWDGKLKGQQQDAGTFIFACEYRFFGTSQVDQIRKGSLVLLR